MAITVTNNKPAVLSPIYTSKVSGPYVPTDFIKETLVAPLFQTVSGKGTASIKANAQDITEDDIIDLILSSVQDSIDLAAETACKELFSQTLVYFDKAPQMTIDTLFAVQAGTKEKLPMPSQTMVYMPATDVIPTAREFLGGQCSADKFFACLTFYARPETLGFYFANSKAFDDFKQYFDGQYKIYQASKNTTPDTDKLVSDFLKLNLNGLSETLGLRNSDSDNNEDFSFARILVSSLMSYTTTISDAEFGCLPFSLKELFNPRSVTFINVEKHSRSSATAIRDEWDLINNATKMKIHLVSQKSLSRLTAVSKHLNNIAQGAVVAARMMEENAKHSSGRQRIMKFSSKCPSSKQMAYAIKKILDKMQSVSKSENVFLNTYHTYNRASRRHPDDFNYQGKSTRPTYKPDIHLYVDTSGSVSEENYQNAIKSCILMAKKFNINLYFNSFSDCLSTTSKLECKNKTVREIYTEFQRIFKVTGGTDYEQIWHYINQSPKRKKEFSLIITDFCWYAPNRFVEHPKNLYYMPLEPSASMSYEPMVHHAENFCKSMLHIDPNIRRKMLF